MPDETSFSTIAEFDSHAIASLVATELRDGGIDPAPVQDPPPIQIAGEDHIFRIDVPDDQRERAVELLGELGYARNLVQD